MALAENSGLETMSTLTALKARQRKENNPHLGVDCLQTGDADMKKQNVIEALNSKREQIQLATQVCSAERKPSLCPLFRSSG